MLSLDDLTIEEMETELKRLEMAIAIKNKIGILEKPETKRRVIKRVSIKVKEEMFSKYNKELAVLFLKFKGVATRKQLETIQVWHVWKQLLESDLIIHSKTNDIDIYIIQAYALSEIVGSPQKTPRFSNTSLIKQLRINNWNIMNFRHDNSPIRVYKGFKTRALRVHEKYEDKVGKSFYYSSPQYQLLASALDVKDKINVGINIKPYWENEKNKVENTYMNTHKKRDSSTGKVLDKEPLKEYPYPEFLVGGKTMFDIFRGHYVNINPEYFGNHVEYHFDYLDHSRNASPHKILELAKALEEFSSIFDATYNQYDYSIVLNFWTDEKSIIRLSKMTNKNNDSFSKIRILGVILKLKRFDYKIDRDVNYNISLPEVKHESRSNTKVRNSNASSNTVSALKKVSTSEIDSEIVQRLEYLNHIYKTGKREGFAIQLPDGNWRSAQSIRDEINELENGNSKSKNKRSKKT